MRALPIWTHRAWYRHRWLLYRESLLINHNVTSTDRTRNKIWKKPQARVETPAIILGDKPPQARMAEAVATSQDGIDPITVANRAQAYRFLWEMVIFENISPIAALHHWILNLP
jgi:hypothetical protein